MKQGLKYPDTILEECRLIFQKDELQTDWHTSGGDIALNSLLVKFEDIGDRNDDIIFDYCFLPILQEDQTIQILQTFATISNKVPNSSSSEMLRFIAKINTQLPIGAFGLFDDSGILYYKHNCYVTKLLNEADNADLINKQTGLMLYQILLFIDPLLDVAEGKKTASESISKLNLL